jgi:hypothetical protein
MSNRLTYNDRVSTLEIRIRMKKPRWESVFLPFWLVMWTIGGVFVIVELARKAPGTDPFLLLWLVGWALAETLVGYASLWLNYGTEIVWTDRLQLTIKRDLFGRGRTRTFEVRNISRLRAAGQYGSMMSSSWSSGMAQWGMVGGNIAFEYGGKTHRFGIWLEEQEAQEVVERLRPFVLEDRV